MGYETERQARSVHPLHPVVRLRVEGHPNISREPSTFIWRVDPVLFLAGNGQGKRPVDAGFPRIAMLLPGRHKGSMNIEHNLMVASVSLTEEPKTVSHMTCGGADRRVSIHQRC